MKKLFFKLKLVCYLPLNILKRNTINFTSRISNNVKINNTDVGCNCYIANNTVINNVKIGNYCSIAPGVQIGGMEHSYWWYSTSTFLSDCCISSNRTIIGNDVWIAAGSVIKQGVNIGDCSVIGAMSFVNKDVPPNSIVIGVPAKVVRERLPKDIFDVLIEEKVFNLSAKEALIKINEIELKFNINNR